MKWFLLALIFFVAAAVLSRRWSSEAASPLVIAQQPESASPSADYQCPPTHPIKTNVASGDACRFYVPGERSYAEVRTDKCYSSPAAALADGCRASRNHAALATPALR